MINGKSLTVVMDPSVSDIDYSAPILLRRLFDPEGYPTNAWEMLRTCEAFTQDEIDPLMEYISATDNLQLRAPGQAFRIPVGSYRKSYLLQVLRDLRTAWEKSVSDSSSMK